MLVGAALPYRPPQYVGTAGITVFFSYDVLRDLDLVVVIDWDSVMYTGWQVRLDNRVLGYIFPRNLSALLVVETVHMKIRLVFIFCV